MKIQAYLALLQILLAIKKEEVFYLNNGGTSFNGKFLITVFTVKLDPNIGLYKKLSKDEKNPLIIIQSKHLTWRNMSTLITDTIKSKTRKINQNPPVGAFPVVAIQVL